METQTMDADASLASQTVTAQEPVSQETSTTAQATQEPQKEAGSQVETPVQATSEESGRVKPKPSEFYEARRENRQLKTTVSALERQLAELTNLVKQKPPETVQAKPKADIFVDPESYLTEREQKLREQLVREITQSWEQKKSVEERQRTMQEATEMIFPKSSPDDGRSLSERIQANPELADKVQNILKETGLEVLSQTHPIQAAKLVSKILESEQPKVVKNPTAIKKSLVGSTATGSPINAGGKTMPTLQEIKAQMEELHKMVDENPNYRYEEEYKTKSRQLSQQLSILAKEQGKGK